MNTIVLCLVVCNFFAAAFFAAPWLLVRREMDKWAPAPTRKERVLMEIGCMVIFLLMLAVVAPLMADLSEGYAALYVSEVGWWTL
jgi:hypothetical protein